MLGDRRVERDGYVTVKVAPGHHRATRHGRVYEHILVVERALGHSLPRRAHVHHVDRTKGNNAPANLVACEDNGYHRLLHMRQDALDACGNPNWRKCGYCGRYDAVTAMVHHATRVTPCYCHRQCRNEYTRNRRVA